MMVQWQSADLGLSLSSFDGFCGLLGVGGIQPYISSRAVHRIQDWSVHPLDDEGKALQMHMQGALEVRSPLMYLGRKRLQ